MVIQIAFETKITCSVSQGWAAFEGNPPVSAASLEPQRHMHSSSATRYLGTILAPNISRNTFATFLPYAQNASTKRIDLDLPIFFAFTHLHRPRNVSKASGVCPAELPGVPILSYLLAAERERHPHTHTLVAANVKLLPHAPHPYCFVQPAAARRQQHDTMIEYLISSGSLHVHAGGRVIFLRRRRISLSVPADVS